MMRGHVADQGGQSMVEIALMLPVLLLIVLGLVDIGRIYAYKAAVTNAAREAAIAGARDPQLTVNDICRRARAELGLADVPNPCATAPMAIDCDRGGIPCDYSDPALPPIPTGIRLFQTDGAAGDSITVTVRYEVQLASAYLISHALPLSPSTACGTSISCLQVAATSEFVGLGR